MTHNLQEYALQLTIEHANTLEVEHGRILVHFWSTAGRLVVYVHVGCNCLLMIRPEETV